MKSFMKTVDIIIVKEKKKILAFSSDPQPTGTSKRMIKIFNITIIQKIVFILRVMQTLKGGRSLTRESFHETWPFFSGYGTYQSKKGCLEGAEVVIFVKLSILHNISKKIHSQNREY